MSKKKIRNRNEMHEISIAYKRPIFNEMPKVENSFDANNIIRKAIGDISLDYQEHFWCLYLNNANKVLGYSEISVGDATGTIVNIPKIFAIAIQVSAKALILVHNHPSGRLKASKADKSIVAKVGRIASLFAINLIDNIIITSESYSSFADQGQILPIDNTLPF